MNATRLPRSLGRVLTPLVLLFLSSCGLFRREPPIERERRELQEAGESAEALIYRGLKVGIRSAPSPLNPDGPDPNATKVNALSHHLLAQLDRPIEDGTEGDGDGASEVEYEPLSPREYLAVAKELYELRETLRETDEDRYPTILRTFASRDPGMLAQTSWYEATHEHMVLALAWLAVRQAPRGFRVYETGKINPAGIETPGLRLGAYLIRGATFLSEEWVWMCEEEMDGYLGTLTEAEAELLIWIVAAREAADIADEDDAKLLAGLHAPGVLVRGICRVLAEQEDEGLDDLASFLADAETLGLESEAVWLVGAYVGIKREDSEMALTNLRKLEASELLDDNERELVSDTIAALEKRKPDRALNKITDKLLVVKIISAYVRRELAKIDWRKQVEETSAGRKLLRLTDLLAREVEQIKSALGPDQLDGLGDTAKQWAGRAGCGCSSVQDRE